MPVGRGIWLSWGFCPLVLVGFYCEYVGDRLYFDWRQRVWFGVLGFWGLVLAVWRLLWGGFGVGVWGLFWWELWVLGLLEG